MCSMVMNRTTSRMWGYLMKVNVYVSQFKLVLIRRPRVARKPIYSSVSKAYGINVEEFEQDVDFRI